MSAIIIEYNNHEYTVNVKLDMQKLKDIISTIIYNYRQKIEKGHNEAKTNINIQLQTDKSSSKNLLYIIKTQEYIFKMISNHLQTIDTIYRTTKLQNDKTIEKHNETSLNSLLQLITIINFINNNFMINKDDINELDISIKNKIAPIPDLITKIKEIVLNKEINVKKLMNIFTVIELQNIYNHIKYYEEARKM